MAREVTPEEETFLSTCAGQFSAYGRLVLDEQLNEAYRAIGEASTPGGQLVNVRAALAQFRIDRDPIRLAANVSTSLGESVAPAPITQPAVLSRKV